MAITLGLLVPVVVVLPVWSEFGDVSIELDPRTIHLTLACAPRPGTVPTENLDPAASGSILDLPEMRIRDRAPVGEDVQSSYFRTTETNREFRRGLMEFAIPRFRDEPSRVTLIFAEGPGAVVPGMPPVDHELSWYAADLRVDVEDFDRPTTFLAGFQDDMQDANNVWSFDVTKLVRESEGGCLGFRAKLVLDPDEARFGAFATSIGRYSWITPHLEFVFESA